MLSSSLLAVHRGEAEAGPVSKGTAAFYVSDMHGGDLDAPVVDVAGYLSDASSGTAPGLKVNHLCAFACEQVEALAKAGAGYAEARNQPVYCELMGIMPPPAGVSWTKGMLDALPPTSSWLSCRFLALYISTRMVAKDTKSYRAPLIHASKG